MNMDQVWGRFGEARARVKEFAGTLLGASAMVLRARDEYAARKAQTAFGDAKSAVQDRHMMIRRGRPG